MAPDLDDIRKIGKITGGINFKSNAKGGLEFSGNDIFIMYYFRESKVSDTRKNFTCGLGKGVCEAGVGGMSVVVESVDSANGTAKIRFKNDDLFDNFDESGDKKAGDSVFTVKEAFRRDYIVVNNIDFTKNKVDFTASHTVWVIESGKLFK